MPWYCASCTFVSFVVDEVKDTARLFENIKGFTAPCTIVYLPRDR
jgi:hypothetical protein